MSTCFEIHSSAGDYSVRIEAGLFDDILRSQTRDILIVDDWFSAQVAAAGRERLAIHAEETVKSLDAIPEFIIALRKFGADRQTALIAIGGGIVQDVVAFVASIYMRGLKWTYLPSTLLSMADSCIGGKSSINVGPYKNLVGTYNPPQSVFIDPSLALTLSDEDRIGGLIEAVKICYCRGDEAFNEYLALNPRPRLSIEELEKVVTCSLLAKQWFIEIDEFDRAERLLLNFGHTFGHAIEGASHFRIGHGIAVGVGILCAIELGRNLGRSYAGVTRVQRLENHTRGLLESLPELRKELSELSMPGVLDRFRADKKHGIAFFSVILIAETGETELVRLPRSEDTMNLVQAAIEDTRRAIAALRAGTDHQ